MPYHTSLQVHEFVFFCSISGFTFSYAKRKPKSGKEKRVDTCKFNNGSKCWITCIDTFGWHPLSTSLWNLPPTFENGMVFIYLFMFFIQFQWNCFTEDIFSEIFSTFSCEIYWWILKISTLDRQSWMVHYNKLPLNCKVYQHWIDNQTHWIFATCFASGKHNVMWTNKHQQYLKLRLSSRERQWQRLAMKTKKNTKQQ